MKQPIALLFRNPFLTEWDKRQARRQVHARLTLWAMLASLGGLAVFAGVMADLGPAPVLAASLLTFAACAVAGFYLAKWRFIR